MEKCERSVMELDPETEFLLSKRDTGNEWELFKENVRPLKRGRKVDILNDALKSHNDNFLKKSLLDQRRSFFFFFFYLDLNILFLYIYIYLSFFFFKIFLGR